MKHVAYTSRTKKRKGPNLHEKTYLPNFNSDDDAFDFSFLDFSEKTFKAPTKLCDGHFINLLFDENILRRSIDGMVDDGDIPGVQQNDHAHLDEDNEDVGVVYKVYDPNVVWKEMRPQLGDCYEPPAHLRNYHFGSLVTSNWLAKHYLKDVIMKPKMTMLEMQADVLQRFSVNISVGQCQRERATSMGMIKGKLEDHYAKVSESGDQDGGPAVSTIKRTKIMERRGGKLKCLDQGTKHQRKHLMQPMIQEKEDVQENDNEVKVNEMVTLKELLLSGYTHADAVATMKEVYGEFEETDVDEKDVQKRDV
ncbi:unnamed protein product [Lactuca saligna]|uniref:Uncharacterized protein n=1 Tax=Lactuca saligna TaxID=75948 RepID=A0AA35VIE0_LACSI|nr:unnamed protein product [Lactuca saligna]